MKKSFQNKTIIFFGIILSILLLPKISLAADNYIRDGGTGDCSDWTNACDVLPATLTRGDTYYIADGSYGSYTFDDAESGTSVITIKKATIADHGIETGWDNAYGDGQAVFGFLQFYTSYYIFDGVTGGGPDSWESGFGFRTKVSGGKNIRLENGASNLIFKHVDMENGGKDTHQSNDDIFYAITGNQNITISHSYMHDVAGTMLLTSGVHGFILEYTKLARTGGGGDTIHREAWSEQGAADNIIIRHNIFEDISNTAFIALVNGNGTAENWKIYGNVFWHTGNSGSHVSSLIQTKYASPTFITPVNWEIYNNTVVNVNGSATIRLSNGTGNKVYNNMWFNNTGNTIAIGANIHDYNWFYNNYRIEGCNPPCNKDNENNEPNNQIGIQDPYIDWQNTDFHLKSTTNAGISLSSPYDIDMDGNTRGSDGVWDIGAYEYISGPPPPPDTQVPTTPANLSATVVSSNQINLSWTASTDNIGVSGYRIYRCQGSGCAPTTQITTSATNSYSDTNLSANTTYTYAVSAYDAAGNNSSQSTSAYATTQPFIPSSPNNLEVSYSFNEGLGTTLYDSSGNNRNAILINNPTWTMGKINNALQFDGINDYADAGTFDISGSNLTFSSWVNLSAIDTSSDYRFISKANGTFETNHWWMLGTTNSNGTKLRFRLKTGGTTATLIASSGNLLQNIWHHVAATYNGSAMKIYLDGIEVGSLSKTGQIDTNNTIPINIARNPNGSNYFSGIIDDVHIYSRALSLSEIQSLASGSSLDTTPPSAPTGLTIQ